MTDKAYANRRFIETVKSDLFFGRITLATAKKRIQPIVDEMNETAKEIARKHGVKYSPMNANSLLR